MSDILQSLQSFRDQLTAEYEEKVKSIDLTISLLGGGSTIVKAKSPIAEVPAAPQKNRPGRPARVKTEDAEPTPKRKVTSSSKERAPRMKSEDIARDVNSLMASGEAYSLNQIAEQIATIQGVSSKFTKEVKNAVYRFMNDGGKNYKRTKKANDGKTIYFSK
jgi:hypothetical protein